MDLALDILSWICLVSGALFGVVAGIGLIRLPDLFTLMHAAGIGDTLATGLILLGLMLQSGWSLNLAKLALILIFIVFTSPTATHAVAKAALHGRLHPLGAQRRDEKPSKT